MPVDSSAWRHSIRTVPTPTSVSPHSHMPPHMGPTWRELPPRVVGSKPPIRLNPPSSLTETAGARLIGTKQTPAARRMETTLGKGVPLAQEARGARPAGRARASSRLLGIHPTQKVGLAAAACGGAGQHARAPHDGRAPHACRPLRPSRGSGRPMASWWSPPAPPQLPPRPLLPRQCPSQRRRSTRSWTSTGWRMRSSCWRRLTPAG